jgi:hypothetical protein
LKYGFEILFFQIYTEHLFDALSNSSPQELTALSSLGTNGLPLFEVYPGFNVVQLVTDFSGSPHALARNSDMHDDPSDQPTILQNYPPHHYQPY